MIKLMIVDDEASIRRGLRHYINWSTWDIQLAAEASSAEEALSLAAQVQPDILLTDIRMGEMNGIELTRRLKELFPALRVILLTGYDHIEYLKEALKIKVDEFLLKPAGADTIIEAVLKLKKEILQEQNKHHSAALRDTLLDENLPVIQMHFIDNVVNGGIKDPSHVKSKAARLEIPMHGPFYQVLLVDYKGNMFEECQSGHEIDMVFWQFLQQMHEIIREAPGAFWCEMGMALGLILVNGDSADDTERVSAQLAKAIVTRPLSIDALYVGIGMPVSDVLALEKSFLSANRALRLSAWHQDMRVLAYPQCAADKEAIAQCRQKEADVLALLASNRGKEAAAAFNGLFSCYRAARYDFGQVLKECEHILNLMRHAEGGGKDDAAPSISGFRDADELEAWMNAYFEKQYFSKGDHQLSALTRKALAYLSEHYREDITLQSLSKKIFVSPNYLGRVFLNDMGYKLGEWLNRYRIDKAKELLCETDMKTYEIAAATGFSSYKHFSVCFLKHAGCSAREYRQKR